MKSSDMKRIAIVTTICPYPKNVGKSVVWGGIIDFLLEWPGAEVRIYSFEQFPASFGAVVKPLHRPSQAQTLVNLIFDVAIRRKNSIQEAFFHSPDTARRLKSELAVFAPDTVVFDTVRTEQYAAEVVPPESRVMTYLDDLFSVRYERVLDAMATGFDADKYVLGNFAEKLPGIARKVFMSSSWLRRAVLKFECKALRRSELRAFAQSDVSLLISPSEVEVSRGLAPAANVLEIPPGMKPSEGVRQWNGSPEFVFLGSLTLAHNVTAVEWFLELCLPLVLKERPDALFKIIGKGSSPRIDAFAKQYPDNVRQLGFVESIDEHLLQACCLISPLLFGSGIKIKVIDALRCGIPVISSSIGAEGLHGIDEGAITLAEGEKAFSLALLAMFTVDANTKASTAAHAVFASYYSEVATQARYRRIFAHQG